MPKRSLPSTPPSERGAEFSTDGLYRYVLWRCWDPSKPTITFIGLNPSVADEALDDQTIRKCISYARKWNFGGLYMVNLFAYRSTDRNVLNNVNNPTGEDNDSWIRAAIEASEKTIAAWGADGRLQNRSNEVRQKFGNLFYLRLTDSGEPSHPLYLPSDLIPIPLPHSSGEDGTVDFISRLDRVLLNRTAIMCADIGSIQNDNFGWAALLDGDTWIGGTGIEEFAEQIAASIKEGRRVSLGFECPLFTPMEPVARRVARARRGEGNRPWSAGAGAGAAALATGFVETAWIFNRVSETLGHSPTCELDWNTFIKQGADTVFIWEAFVSGSNHTATHQEDAKAAVLSFALNIADPMAGNCVKEREVISFIGAIALRTGWATDVSILSQPCLVIKPLEQPKPSPFKNVPHTITNQLGASFDLKKIEDFISQNGWFGARVEAYKADEILKTYRRLNQPIADDRDLSRLQRRIEEAAQQTSFALRPFRNAAVRFLAALDSRDPAEIRDLNVQFSHAVSKTKRLLKILRNAIEAELEHNLDKEFENIPRTLRIFRALLENTEGLCNDWGCTTCGGAYRRFRDTVTDELKERVETYLQQTTVSDLEQSSDIKMLYEMIAPDAVSTLKRKALRTVDFTDIRAVDRMLIRVKSRHGDSADLYQHARRLALETADPSLMETVVIASGEDIRYDHELLTSALALMHEHIGIHRALYNLCREWLPSVRYYHGDGNTAPPW